jgi:hypothetical protein
MHNVAFLNSETSFVSDSWPAPSSREYLVVTDIAENLTIQSDFSISHTDYVSYDLPQEISQRLNSLPPVLKAEYLSLQLRGFLYGIFYNGSLRKSLAVNNSSGHSNLQASLENNTYLGVDLQFYERLHEANSGQGYFDPGWLVLRQEVDQTIAVQKLGLKLHIRAEQHLQDGVDRAETGQLVSIRLPKNLVQNGFYMAVGNQGSESHGLWVDAAQPDIVRFYFNFVPEGAVQIMAALTDQLNAATLPFSFKVLYNPSDYGRYDSGVLYIERQNYSVVASLLASIHHSYSTYFCPEIPLFTKLLLPGLSVAEEPQQKFSAQESFGLNRCQIVARGLLAARESGDESAENRLAAILHEFDQLGLSLERPHLNPGSVDIYTPLC